MQDIDIAIEEFNATQLSAVINFLKEEFGQGVPLDALSNDIIETCLEGKLRPRYIVALSNGEIVGTIGYRESMVNFGYAEICYLCVAQNFRFKGIGRKLMNEAFVASTNKFNASYHIVSTNIPKFFRKFGFKKIFTDGKNAILMIRG